MSWGMHVIVPGRVVYVDYFNKSGGQDVSDALKAVLEETNKSADQDQTFYCVSGVSGSGGAKLSELNDVFRTVKSFPKNTKTILVTKNRASGFLAQLVHSLRGLSFAQVATLHDALKLIEREDPELAKQISIEDFQLLDSDKAYTYGDNKKESES